MKNKRLIFLITYLAYTSIYIARINLSISGSELINLGIMDTAQIGLLGSVFSTVYACGRLLNGGISDTAPPWKMLTGGLAVAGLSNILISFFPPFAAIFIFWTANAYAQSMLWSSVICVITAVYDPDTAKKRMTLMVTSVATGNILAILLNTYFITAFGVKYAFIIPGALTIILGLLVFVFTKHIPGGSSEKSEKHSSLFALLKNKDIVTMCLPAMFHGVMKENISLWMAIYIVDTYLVDLTESSYYILLIPVIGLFGRLLYTPFYKLCKENENTVSLLGFVICFAAAVPLLFKFTALSAALALAVIYTSVSVINTSLLSIYPLRYQNAGNSASVSGIMDFFTYLGGGVSGVIYGVVIKYFGYIPMFVSWIVLSLISVLILSKKQK